MDDLLSILEELLAVGAEMAQLHLLSYPHVSLGDFVEGFDGRHIHHAALLKVDDDFLGIIENVKLLVEYRNGTKE